MAHANAQSTTRDLEAGEMGENGVLDSVKTISNVDVSSGGLAVARLGWCVIGGNDVRARHAAERPRSSHWLQHEGPGDLLAPALETIAH